MCIPIITSPMQESYEAGTVKTIFQAKWLSKYDTLIIAMIVMELMVAASYIHGPGIMLCICLQPYMKSMKRRMS